VLFIMLPGVTVRAAEVVSPREPFFGMEKVQLRIEYQKIPQVAARIHNMFSRQGWYRVEPGQSLIEICDSAERLEAIQAVVERFDRVPRSFAMEISLMNYVGTGEEAAAPAATALKAEPRLSTLNRQMALKRQVSSEAEVGREQVAAREGQFVEFPLGQGYNVEFQVGYFDRTKELIQIKRLVFSQVRVQAGKKERAVILTTDLQLGNGVKHLLTMRKPGCREYYTLAIRATLREEPPPPKDAAQGDDDLPVREWP
jgi:hypothetical protein